MIFRFDSSLFFASANHFGEDLQTYLAKAAETVHQVLIDAETINLLDTTAAEILLELQTSLDKQGITLAFARVHDPVKDKMALTGVVDAVGVDRFFDTVMEGVEAFGNSKQETTK